MPNFSQILNDPENQPHQWEVVDLTRPHGFLVWRGKQTAIVSPTLLSIGEVLVTSDGEAFGIATLGQPSQIALSEFSKEEWATKHCMRIEEREELWPTSTSFYVHDIKSWQGFNPPLLIIQPTLETSMPIGNNRKLLKTIIIDPNVISEDEINGVKSDELSITLEATFSCAKPTDSKMFYQLVLNGQPTLRFEDVKKKETAMPYEINDDECIVNSETGEVEKCHDSHEEAMAHLAALNINVVAEEKAGRRLAGTWRDKLRAAKDALMELVTWAEYEDEQPEEETMATMLKGSSGVAIKMVSGEPWHLSWSSNSFQDRDKEIFSLKSLEQYVAENEESEVKGYFNLWHIKGTDFAEKRYQAIIGKFLFEAGPYLKDEKGQKALAFFKQYSDGHPEIAPEGWGASVEYKYLPEERKSKVYQWTWITRTSTLARGAAANIWTKSAQQESIMTDEQKKAAIAVFGEEFTNGLIGQGEQKTKELEDAGVANKGKEAEVKSEEQPTPDQLVEVLATKMLGNLNEALTPVLQEFQQQIIGLKEQVTTLSDDLKALKGEQAMKNAVELPRFTFQALRASQSSDTVVPEGDALKNQKPQEAVTVDSGSLTAAYFPSRKG